MIEFNDLERKKNLKNRYGLINFLVKVVITLKRVKIPWHFLQKTSPPPLYFWACLHSLSVLNTAGYFTVSGAHQPFSGSAFNSSISHPFPSLSAWQIPPLLEGLH